MIFTKIVIINFRKNIENSHVCYSEKFRWWIMLAESHETSQLWILKFASLEISNSKSVRVKYINFYDLDNEISIKVYKWV